MRDDNDTLREEGRAALDPSRDLEVVNGGAPAGPAPFAVVRSYTPADLDRDRTRLLVSLARLPPFTSDRDDCGWGVGRKLDELLGGGLAPGDVVALGAAGAGAGKTAFAMQIADGLALRSADLIASNRPGVLTPTVLLSEMPPEVLARRTLARLVDVPASVFRSGVAATSWALWSVERVNEAYARARCALEPGGAFARLAPWQRVARPEGRGVAMLRALATYVDELREDLARRHPGREVWPVVVVDPIQRWQEEEAGEVEALNVLSEELDRLADDGKWIALVTSDTNKTSAVDASKAAAGAKDATPPEAAALFRGSYKLFHAADAAIVLRPERYDHATHGAGASRAVTVEIAKNRHGPAWGEVAFAWHAARGLFVPAPPIRIPPTPDASQVAKSEKQAGPAPAPSRYSFDGD